MSPEHERLAEAGRYGIPWRVWGPYLSERQWGTVREDTSRDGNAWESFSHDQARWRAYRWGEDGLAGIADDKQRLCLALALWNGRDPLLKERLFGLTNGEGNHGEDVKEYYFYLDATPTHSWMRYLYKYPQAAFPYDDLVRTNRLRSTEQPEYELLDTGVFDTDRYFDVFVTYAKASPTDILVDISVCNRGADSATLHLLPTLWFRNTWSWGLDSSRPELRQAAPGLVAATHPALGTYWLACQDAPPLLFTENETRAAAAGYAKDAIHEAIVRHRPEAVNPEQVGTKVAAHYLLDIEPGGTRSVRLRLSAGDARSLEAEFDQILQAREREADAFYAVILPASLDEDQRRISRQAFAGLLWNKQYYAFDVAQWLRERGVDPYIRTGAAPSARNGHWAHLVADDVISMPDKWEYPWYAAWDLAFQAVAFALVDVEFAKQQVHLLLRHQYLHPNGQLPAYEWSFDDVNPPVHAWAAYFIYAVDKAQQGHGDRPFLRSVFEKLVLNFSWWVNRKDPSGSNVFEGGFLGVDNIGVFDRSQPLPTGGSLEQADGTAWMAFFSQVMLAMALELAPDDPLYEDFAARFLEQALHIIAAMDRLGDQQDELWDEQDGFFYDVLRLPDGSAMRLKVRSLVGLLPLCATVVGAPESAASLPRFQEHVQWLREHRPELARHMAQLGQPGAGGRLLFSALDEPKLRRLLTRLLDEEEFLSSFGIRSLSRRHLAAPYVLSTGGREFRVAYEPAESSLRMFGGNSNWRGPIWVPINTLVIRALELLATYYGDAFTVEMPTGSGERSTLGAIARELTRRLERIFRRDAGGRRPVYGGTTKFQDDPHWRDLILFYEYFHGDNGAGIGASHQTGWTALVAAMTCYFAQQVSNGSLAAECLVEGARR